jgi:hypothetical protein
MLEQVTRLRTEAAASQHTNLASDTIRYEDIASAAMAKRQAAESKAREVQKQNNFFGWGC